MVDTGSMIAIFSGVVGIIAGIIAIIKLPRYLTRPKLKIQGILKKEEPDGTIEWYVNVIKHGKGLAEECSTALKLDKYTPFTTYWFGFTPTRPISISIRQSAKAFLFAAKDKEIMFREATSSYVWKNSLNNIEDLLLEVTVASKNAEGDTTRKKISEIMETESRLEVLPFKPEE